MSDPHPENVIRAEEAKERFREAWKKLDPAVRRGEVPPSGEDWDKVKAALDDFYRLLDDWLSAFDAEQNEN